MHHFKQDQGRIPRKVMEPALFLTQAKGRSSRALSPGHARNGQEASVNREGEYSRRREQVV